MGKRKRERSHINMERSTESKVRIRKENRILWTECYTRGRKAGRYLERNLGQSEENYQKEYRRTGKILTGRQNSEANYTVSKTMTATCG